MRWSLGTTGSFIDLSSLAVSCVIRNKSTTHPLQILGSGLGTLVQEMTVHMGGVQVERVPSYNRTEALFQRLMPWAKRIQLYDEQLGYGSGNVRGDDFISAEIPASDSREILWRPLASGLCSQRNFIPTAFISQGVTLEINLVTDPTEVCDTAANHSTDYELLSVKLLVDSISVDPAFLTPMSRHLLNNGSLTLHPKQYQTVHYNVNSPSMQLVSARAMTRPNTAFVTFYRDGVATTQKKCHLFYLSANGQNMFGQAQIGERIFQD